MSEVNSTESANEDVYERTVPPIADYDIDNTVVERVMEDYNVTYSKAREMLLAAARVKGESLPRQKRARKLSDEEVASIKERLDTGHYYGIQTALAAEFGVSRNLIQRIQYGTY